MFKICSVKLVSLAEAKIMAVFSRIGAIRFLKRLSLDEVPSLGHRRPRLLIGRAPLFVLDQVGEHFPVLADVFLLASDVEGRLVEGHICVQLLLLDE